MASYLPSTVIYKLAHTPVKLLIVYCRETVSLIPDAMHICMIHRIQLLQEVLCKFGKRITGIWKHIEQQVVFCTENTWRTSTCCIHLRKLAPTLHDTSWGMVLLQLSVWCAEQKTWDLNGCPLFCMFFAKDVSGNFIMVMKNSLRF